MAGNFPVSIAAWGSPYGPQGINAYPSTPLQPVTQFLQIVPQQLQQLQQLVQVIPQQLYQLQQIVQLLSQQIQQQLLAQQSGIGFASASPFQPISQIGSSVFTSQPGHLM